MTSAITGTPHADDCWSRFWPMPFGECTCGAAESDAIIKSVTDGFRRDLKEILECQKRP